MSEDDRTEEETSEEIVDEEIEATAADDAGEDEEFLAGEVEIPQGGGCSAGTWVIILLIIAALIYITVWQVQKNAGDIAKKEAAQRQQVRDTQMADIAGDITAVEAGLQQGDIAGAIETLRQMDQKLGIVQTAANADGDTEAAGEILATRTSVETAVEEIERQHAALQEIASERMADVRNSMGVLAPPVEVVPDPAEESGDEPAGDVEETPDPEATADPEAVPDVEPAPDVDLAPDADLAPVDEPTPDMLPGDGSGVPAGEPYDPANELAPAG